MIHSIFRPKHIFGSFNTAASLVAITLTTIGLSTESAEAGGEYLRKLTFDNATYNPTNSRSSGCGVFYDFDGIRIHSPDIPNQLGLVTVKKANNDSNGNFKGGLSWLSESVRYKDTGKSLAISFPSTSLQCNGQKEEQRFVEQNSVVAGSGSDYVFQFGQSRYTGFAIKFGNKNRNSGSSAFQSPQGNTRERENRTLVCQWWQQTGHAKKPPLALYVYKHPGDSRKLDYEVIARANSSAGDTEHVIFTGTVLKKRWYRMVFYTVFNTNSSANAPVGTIGFWIDGNQKKVAAGSGDSIVTNNDKWWQNYVGWTEGGLENTAFSGAIYRWAQPRRQVVYFDNVSVTRMTNNNAGGAAFNMADPDQF